MATGKIAVTEGSGVNVATNSISEDAVTKQLSRNVINNSSGVEIGIAGSPIYTVGSVSGTVNVSGTTSVNGTINVGSVLTAVSISQIGSVVGAFTPYAQPTSYVWGVSSVVTGTTANSVLAAPGVSLRNYITTIKVTNAAANAVIVDIKDSGGNVLDSGYAAASGGGWSTTFTVPIRQTNTNASVDVVPRTQGSVIAAIVGYVAA